MNTKKTSLYDQDFYGWTQQQGQALVQKQLSKLDWENLQEEIQSLRRQEYRELVSRLRVLLGHLFKGDYHPEKRSRSWFLTIREQRRAIQRHFNRNPSLQSCLIEAVEDGFEAGIDLALRETDLPLRVFPDSCPYQFEEIMTERFLCNPRQDWP